MTKFGAENDTINISGKNGPIGMIMGNDYNEINDLIMAMSS